MLKHLRVALAAVACWGVHALPVQAITPAQGNFLKEVLKCLVNKNDICIIKENLGGIPLDFQYANDIIKRWRITVVFDGPCASACGMYLTWEPETTCITSNATFFLHRQRNPKTGALIAEKETLELFTNDGVRQLIKEKGGLPIADRLEDARVITSKEILAIGGFRSCEIVNGHIVWPKTASVQ